MIIQCPSCQTRFSLDERQLEGIARPRYRCSRCSHQFEGIGRKMSDSPRQLSLLSTDSPSVPTWTPPAPKPEITAPHRQVVAHWPADNLQYDVEEENFEQDDEPAGTTRQQRFCRWGSVKATALVLSLPLLVFAGIFVTASRLKAAPTPLMGLWGIGSPGAAVVAPPGLEVLDLDGKTVTLESGKSVLDITGVIRNTTLATYFDTQLEASLYDESNNLLASRRVPAHSNVASAITLNALRAEVINDLQTKADNQRQIVPNQKLPFRVVFTDSHDAAAYFSVRVFSVRHIE